MLVVVGRYNFSTASKTVAEKLESVVQSTGNSSNLHGGFCCSKEPPATTRQPLWKHVTKATGGYHRVTVVTSGSGLHSSNASAGEHTASYLPGEPQPADGRVVQTQNHGEEGQQVLLLLTAETQKNTLIFKPTTEEEADCLMISEGRSSSPESPH